VTHPVVDEAKQFQNLGDLRGSFHQLIQDSAGIRESFVGERPGRLVEASDCPSTGLVAQNPPQEDVGIG